MANRRKLTPAVQEHICSLLLAGAEVKVAAGAVGIDRSTLYRWMWQGEKQKRGVYRDFLDAVTRARDVAEMNALAVITQAAKGIDPKTPGDWRAAAWFLEHGRQERWRSHQAVELAGKGGGPLKVDSTQRSAPAFDLTQLSDDELAVFEALAAKMAAGSSGDADDDDSDD